MALPFNVDKRKRWNESEFGVVWVNLTTGGGYGKAATFSASLVSSTFLHFKNPYVFMKE